jgi:hypothetical protein
VVRRLSSTERRAALATLGLPDHATGRQITDAYRRLARATHPDTTGRTDDQAGTNFVAISDAYQLLTDQPDAPAPAADGAPAPTPRTRRAPDPWQQRPGPQRPASQRPPIVAGPVTVTPSPPVEPSRARRRR